MIINPCYNSTEPNIGLKLNMERVTMKCYMADTGLLISHAFDENEIVNSGMIMENIVAQMLRASKHKLFFYSNTTKESKEDRMKIDFLIAKSKTTNRHNISPIEVKSSKNYTLTSLKKFIKKYPMQLDTPYVLHVEDLKLDNDIVYLPVYMTCLL